MRRITVVGVLAALALSACAGDADDAADDSSDDTGTETATNLWLDGGIVNIAHRGGAAEAPEDTLYALETAAQRGADAIEFDVHASSDGVAVVIHDDTVDRTTDGTGCVVGMSLDELQTLDAAYSFTPADGELGEYPYRGVATGAVDPPEGFDAADFTVPTLESVLESLGDVPMILEIKTTDPQKCPELAAAGAAPDDVVHPGLVDEVARLIDEYDVSDQVAVASFDDGVIAAFAAAAPDVMTSFPEGQGFAYFGAFQEGEEPQNPLGHGILQAPVDIALTIDRTELEAFLALLVSEGIAAQVWTINDAATMELALDWGADGIITDDVSLLASVIDAR